MVSEGTHSDVATRRVIAGDSPAGGEAQLNFRFVTLPRVALVASILAAVALWGVKV